MTEKRENVLASIAINIAIPALVLMKLSGPDALGPVAGLVVALAFPLVYGIVDFARRREWNFVSILGFVSVLLTGGIGLLKLDPKWIAVKEAAVPGLIGLAVLASLKTRFPIVRSLLYNERIIRIENVEAALEANGNRGAFDKTLVVASMLIMVATLMYLFRSIRRLTRLELEQILKG
jgi:hypothetical protein